jgi:hypothetical protein
MSRSTIRCLVGLFASATIVYGVLSFGGIRFPDSEIVYLTAESLATTGTFAVQHDLAAWPDFGLATGRDGRRYSVFGPGEAVSAVPFVWLGMALNETKWYERASDWVRLSVYADARSETDRVQGRRPPNLAPHAIRSVVSLHNVLVGALGVVVFFLLLRLLTQSDAAALWVSLLFAFGTLWMPYTGTFFSEPLATLLVLASLYFLVWNDVALHTGDVTPCCRCNALTSGLFLGIAVATHLTAILFAPFFFAYAIYPFFRKSRFGGTTLSAAIAWLVGLGLLLALLGYYNYTRFGNPLETGRWVDPALAKACIYGTFTAPWQGLYELPFGVGKGLLLFCPAVLLGVLLCKSGFRQYRFLTLMIFAAALFRIGFIASRSDWHGGFCLGPRYLVMIVPLLLVPLGPCVADWMAGGSRRALQWCAFGSILCSIQAVYFCVGNILDYYFTLKLKYVGGQCDIFKDNLIYTSWRMSPLPHLLDVKRCPALLRFVPADNFALFVFLAMLFAAVLAIVYRKLLPRSDH